jgi:murein DD-endopeptidase MepM/ murein hydrolase activator NlpD
MHHKNSLLLLGSLLFLNGCLQNPAPIDGIDNYYTNSNKYKKQQYRNIELNNQNNQIFQDELISKNKVFDPYTSITSNNLQNDIDHNKNIENLDKKQNESNNKDEKDSDIDWNNIFNEVKNQKFDSNQDFKKSEKQTSQIEIKKSKIDENSKTNKPTTKIIPSTKHTEKNIQKQSIIPNQNIENTKQNLQNIEKPYIVKPTNGQILAKYGQNQNSELDDGVTFTISDKIIKSSGDGKIIYIDGENSSHKTIIIKHHNGIISSYSYNGDVKTSVNREVKTGQTIGESNDKNDILYFTVRQNGKTIDPEKIMK